MYSHFLKATGKAKPSFTSSFIEKGQTDTRKDEVSLKHAAATIFAGGSDTVLISLHPSSDSDTDGANRPCLLWRLSFL